MRIIVANEPAAYRDVLAGALALLQPEAQVVVIEPDLLDTEITRSAPTLVFCSRLSEAVTQGPLAWVLLDCENESGAVVSIGGRKLKVPNIHLDDILSVVAWTEMIV